MTGAELVRNSPDFLSPVVPTCHHKNAFFSDVFGCDKPGSVPGGQEVAGSNPVVPTLLTRTDCPTYGNPAHKRPARFSSQSGNSPELENMRYGPNPATT